MKTKNPFGILMLFLFTFTVIGCDKEENSEEGKKVTDYQEYELTVASKQLLGFAYFDGKKLFRKVYAVKKMVHRIGNRFLLFRTSLTKKATNIV